MATPKAGVDWLIDAEIALYRSRGWSWESIAAFFGMSEKTARRRCERYRAERESRRGAVVGG